MSDLQTRVLVVGQTPPPYGGQAIMIQHLLQGTYPDAILYHVRMSFSKDMNDLKKIRFGKILHAFCLVVRVLFLRFQKRTEILYYPPSGPEFSPLLRDIFLLVLTRWAFKKTVFHFHAAGLSDFYQNIPILIRPFFWIAFRSPDVAISPSAFNPKDGGFLSARCSLIVPNGISDEFSDSDSDSLRCKSHEIFTILYVGLITETKGIEVLVDAAIDLKKEGKKFRVVVMGRPRSDEYLLKLKNKISSADLTDCFLFVGVLVGVQKSKFFLSSHVFCLPTFFESESFSLVTLEAMSFGLPVVVTRWRGLQSLVIPEVSGYCVDPKDSRQIYLKLKTLIEDRYLCEVMGDRGREFFLNNFTLQKFYLSMNEVFRKLK